MRAVARMAKNQRRRNLLYLDPFRCGRYFLEMEGYLAEGERESRFSSADDSKLKTINVLKINK